MELFSVSISSHRLSTCLSRTCLLWRMVGWQFCLARRWVQHWLLFLQLFLNRTCSLKLVLNHWSWRNSSELREDDEEERRISLESGHGTKIHRP